MENRENSNSKGDFTMIIAILMLAVSVFGLAYGLKRKKADMVLIMAFMVLFSAWCVRYGHTIGMNPEPVRIAGKAVNV